MRKEFSKVIEKIGKEDKKVIFMTGDLGFMALEGIREIYGDRFINAGVSEQNMITMAAAMASEGFKVLCYSIAPFVVFRPAEQIRLDVCLHNMDVKIIGNGGGYGYGIMGATHHAIEDIAALSSFQNMRCYIPFCAEDTKAVVTSMMRRQGPAYLRLAKGALPENFHLAAYKPLRRIVSGSKVTVIAFGPVVLNVLEAISKLAKDNLVDLFVVSELPMTKINRDFAESLNRTGKLIIYEEHVRRGGLGENLAVLLLENQINTKVKHLYAKGYPNNLYGSQQYHFRVNNLDTLSLKKAILKLADE